MRKYLRTITAVFMASAMLLAACGKEEEKKAEKTLPAETEEQPQDGFAYEEKDYGIVLTKYYGKDENVEIPEEIDGQVVVGLEPGMFDECSALKNVKIPATVEVIRGGIFSKFPDVTIEGYENTKSEEVAYNEQLTFNSLGEYTGAVRYVEIYDTETKGVMQFIRLQDGEKGKEGEYSEGASFSVKDGVATLTLDNYNGGMIMAGGYGSLTIELAEGSVNNINAANENEGIGVRGNLVIEGNASLSIKAGDMGDGFGVWAWGDLTIQNQVHMFVKSGAKESSATCVMEARNILIAGSQVELQVGKTGTNSMAICASSYANEEDGKLELQDCHIAEGGEVVDIIYNFEGVDYRMGQSVSEQPRLEYNQADEILSGGAEYVRIERDGQ